MVKNTKIKTFLTIAFAVILLVVAVIGGVSIYYTRTMAQQTTTFYKGSHTTQLEIETVRTVMTQMGSDIKEALIYRTPEATSDTTTALASQMEKMNNHIALAVEHFTGDPFLIQTADQKLAAWLAANEELRVAMEAQQYDTAQEIFFNTYIPAEQAVNLAVQNISAAAADISESYYLQASADSTKAFVVILSMIIFALLLMVSVCTIIIRSILVPLDQIEEAARQMSMGNLHHTLAFEGQNEFGRLAGSMRQTMDTLGQYVKNIDFVLEHIASNDMTVGVDIEYVGDFAPIRDSLERILSSLNGAMLQIKESSSQVAEHSNQISISGQSLAQGSTEQAGAVQELAATIEEISQQVQESTSYTDEINKLVNDVGSKLSHGNVQMSEMLSAISEINNASSQIAKIIKTIEDIAFQTNILALNAAVEAARAGAAGKGFAVVADEVRNLAAKSGAAAKSTTELIQNSIRAVDNGTHIATETAKTLGVVVEGAGHITDMVGKIAVSAKDQAQSIVEISEAIEQITQVVANNSATAEESAASSEELNSQAQMLRSLAGAFRLKDAPGKQLDAPKAAYPKKAKTQSYLSGGSVLPATNW